MNRFAFGIGADGVSIQLKSASIANEFTLFANIAQAPHDEQTRNQQRIISLAVHWDAG
jgi:hypothetical protein